MKTKLTSPFRYAGTKAELCKTICKYAAQRSSGRHVVDVFTGGGAFLLNYAAENPNGKLIANDTYRPVAAFWRCIADPPKAELLCTSLPDKPTPKQVKDAVDALKDMGLDDVALAAAAIVRSWTTDGDEGIADPPVLNSGYNARVLRNRVRSIAKAMAGRLTVHEDDFATVVRKNDHGYVLFLDPPYEGLGDMLYDKPFTDTDLQHLTECLAELKNAYWVMVNKGMDSVTCRLHGRSKPFVALRRDFSAYASSLQRQTAIAVPPKQGRHPTGAKLAKVEEPKSLTTQETKLLAGCEAAIGKAMRGVLEGFVDIGSQLRQINHDRLYRADYGTFADYCWGRWHWSPGRAYQFIRGVEVFDTIKEHFARRKVFEEALTEGLVPANEAQVRSLVPLMGDDTDTGTEAVCAVWKRVLDRTVAGDPLTAALVAEEVEKWEAEHGKEQRAPWDYTASPLGNLHRLESRIGKVTDVQAIDSAMAQLQDLLKLLKDQRAQLTAVKPQDSAPV